MKSLIKNIASYKKSLKLIFMAFSLVLLFVFVQNVEINQQGPKNVLADMEDFTQIGPGNVSEPWFFEPIPGITDQPAPQPAAPVTPAAPSCGNFEFKYNECFACNKSRRVEQNACGEYKTSENPGVDAACSSWCPAPEQPAQPAAPACVPNDQIRTEQDCVGNQWCTFNIWRGSSCNEGRGGAYNCQTIPGKCGVPVPQQPTPVTPVTPVVPVVPVVPVGQPQLPACPTLATNIVCGQRAYDTCHERVVGGVKYYDCTASQNPNCTGTIQCSQPAPQTPTQNTEQRAQCPSGTTTVISNNNVITCINNSNQQQQSQTQNVTQHNNQVINIPGGIVARTEIIREQPVAVQVARVDCPAGTVKKVVDREVVCEVTGRAVATVAGAKELPKTGLPALAWAAGAFVPLGMKLRRFSKLSGHLTSTPNYIWEDREFKK